MKAAVYYETGGPEVFRYEEVPDPVPGTQDLLVQVEAISIEGGDTLARAMGELGAVPAHRGVPVRGDRRRHRGGRGGIRRRRPGRDRGTRRVSRRAPGRARRRSAGRCLGGLSIEEAACVPVPFGTADDCLFEFGRLQPGETALDARRAGVVWGSRPSRWRAAPGPGCSPPRPATRS